MIIVKCPKCKSVQNTIYTKYEACMNDFDKKCIVCGEKSLVRDFIFIKDDKLGNFIDFKI